MYACESPPCMSRSRAARRADGASQARQTGSWQSKPGAKPRVRPRTASSTWRGEETLVCSFTNQRNSIITWDELGIMEGYDQVKMLQRGSIIRVWLFDSSHRRALDQSRTNGIGHPAFELERPTCDIPDEESVPISYEDFLSTSSSRLAIQDLSCRQSMNGCLA
jgi:hypothetical protein